jgi:hypothetical protein
MLRGGRISSLPGAPASKNGGTAGRRAEAYENYALGAYRGASYLATFRAIAKKYPEVEPDRLLSDLIATTPGEGNWLVQLLIQNSGCELPLP